MHDRQVQWAGLWFMLVTAMYIGLSYLWPAAQETVGWNIPFFSQILVTQLGILLLPAFALRSAMKMPPLRWRVSANRVLLVLGMAVGINMALLFFNVIWVSLIQLLGWKAQGTPMPPLDTWVGWLLGLVFIAMLPAFVEEYVFRGALQTALRPLGERKAIWWTAFLFALMHLDPQGLPGRWLLGLVLGYLACVSGGLGLSSVYHFIHNACTVTLLSLALTYIKWAQEFLPRLPAMQGLTDMTEIALPTGAMLGIVLLILLPFGIGGMLLFWCCLQFYRRSIQPSHDPLGQWGREWGRKVGLPHGQYVGTVDVELPVLGRPLPGKFPLVWPLWAATAGMLAVYVLMWIR